MHENQRTLEVEINLFEYFLLKERAEINLILAGSSGGNAYLCVRRLTTDYTSGCASESDKDVI